LNGIAKPVYLLKSLYVLPMFIAVRLNWTQNFANQNFSSHFYFILEHSHQPIPKAWGSCLNFLPSPHHMYRHLWNPAASISFNLLNLVTLWFPQYLLFWLVFLSYLHLDEHKNFQVCV
jgi:hypothetical protein